MMSDYKLYHGCCLEVMDKLIHREKIQVDCVITDPAYKVISGGNSSKGRPTGILKENDGKIFKENNIKIWDWMPRIYMLMKDPSHAYIMTNFLNLRDMLNCAHDLCMPIHNLLVWKKNTTNPNRWYMKNVEYTIFARKGKAFSINNKGSQTCQEHINPTNRIHPTQKPLSLMIEYIENSTQPGDIVLDPFMGSGVVGVACKLTGRKFIGIEKDEHYFEVAQKNIVEHEIITNNNLENFIE